jgi:hypothetical protein
VPREGYADAVAIGGHGRDNLTTRRGVPVRDKR